MQVFSLDLEKQPSGLFPACSFCKGEAEKGSFCSLLSLKANSLWVRRTHTDTNTHTPTTEQPKTTHTHTDRQKKEAKRSLYLAHNMTKEKSLAWGPSQGTELKGQ